MSYSLHKISIKRGKSYIKWVINNRARINPQNKDNKCFQYSITVALNHQNIENHPERISKIKPFVDQYNWKDIDFPPRIKEWKKFERNNKTIALNILSIPHNAKTINLAYKSKYNHKRENQVVLLMITNDEQWHYIALKSVRTADGFNRPIRSLSRLFRGITANDNRDFYCLGCLYPFRTDNALKRHERLCDNNDYCYVEMPTEDNKRFKYNRGETSLKAPFTIYADLECLLIKDSGYSLSFISSFNSKENKNSVYRGRDCIEKFCKDLKGLATKIISYEEKDMIPLTDNENKFYEE